MAFSLRDYEIIEEIGHGGFGTILKARQKSLGRIVAIKSLLTQRTLHQKEILRFRREAEAMALLSHDNIISVFDYAYYGNNYYIVMEFIDGMTLDEALTMDIPVQVLMLIMEKVVSGLKVAHAEKVIHRDIKPSNILLGKQGQVKLADFGLATFQPEVSKYSSSAAVLGTFCYMAPEAMVTPKEVDARVDVFSLGCILYKILTGTLPFPGTTIGEVSYKVLNEAPAPIQTGKPFQDFITITAQCLEKDREKRPSLDTLHSALQEAVSDQYHTAQEELQKYISESKRGSGTSSRMHTPQTIVEKRKNTVTLAVVTGAVCILIAGILLFRQFILPGRFNDDSLPQLSGISNTQSLSSPNASVKKSVPKKLSGESPKPLTSTTLDVATGTLIITGVSRKDSITINDKKFPGKKEHGKCKATLKPGHYRIVVHHKDKGIMVRKIRVMPYQVMILDVENERITHGTDTEK